ncbi:MAG: ABC transporter permease [Bacteroidales bacterium]|nr:ABC transporter permease [Bacteroidales bacterium]MBN2818099.1 ABC transporter permease [Bacteroidales bacterium]
MLDLGVWQEIFSTMGKNKLRTFLTSFSVFWGIFILMILLGSGNGLKKGVMHNFSDATNSVWMWGGMTSMAHEGLNSGRAIEFKNDDLEILDRGFDELENLSGRIGLWGGEYHTNYKNEYGDFGIQAIMPGHQVTENIKPMSGRLLNQLDMDKFRKVTVIGRIVQERLFKNEDPIGKYVNINGMPFLVVGVFDDVHEGETERLYIPLTVAQKTFRPGTAVNTITFTTGNATVAESEVLIEEIKQKLAKKHGFNVEDQSAMGAWNALKEYKQMLSLFNGINIFVGIIGIFTLIAGLVGVSNIMLIVVKERTKEIGIRKAIGATPGSIIGLVILESLVITAVAGYLGLLCGIGLLEFIASKMPASDFFRNPGVDFRVAIGAALMVVLAGVIAGFVPARRAAKIKPIIALRDE